MVCSILGCQIQGSASQVTLSSIKKRNPRWERQLLDVIGIDRPWDPTAGICAKHFKPSCFSHKVKPKELKEWSLPTENLPAIIPHRKRQTSKGPPAKRRRCCPPRPYSPSDFENGKDASKSPKPTSSKEERRMKKCIVEGCGLDSKMDEDVSFYRFPRDSVRLSQWKISLNLPPYWTPEAESFICGKHFISGIKSYIPSHPDFVPSVLPSSTVDQIKELRTRLRTFESGYGLRKKPILNKPPVKQSSESRSLDKTPNLEQSEPKGPIEEERVRLPVHDVTENCSEQMKTNCPSPEQVKTSCSNPVKMEANCPSPVKMEANCPSPEQMKPNCPSSEQMKPNCPSPEQMKTNCPSPEQIKTTCPSQEQVKTNCPGREQMTTSCPSTEQMETNCPSPEQMKTKSPSPVRVKEISPRPEQMKTNCPSSVGVKENCHGSEQMKTNCSGSEQMKTNCPVQMKTNCPNQVQMKSTCPSQVQMKTNCPSPEQMKTNCPSPVQVKKDVSDEEEEFDLSKVKQEPMSDPEESVMEDIETSVKNKTNVSKTSNKGCETHSKERLVVPESSTDRESDTESMEGRDVFDKLIKSEPEDEDEEYNRSLAPSVGHVALKRESDLCDEMLTVHFGQEEEESTSGVDTNASEFDAATEQSVNIPVGATLTPSYQLYHPHSFSNSGTTLMTYPAIKPESVSSGHFNFSTSRSQYGVNRNFASNYNPAKVQNLTVSDQVKSTALQSPPLKTVVALDPKTYQSGLAPNSVCFVPDQNFLTLKLEQKEDSEFTFEYLELDSPSKSPMRHDSPEDEPMVSEDEVESDEVESDPDYELSSPDSVSSIEDFHGKYTYLVDSDWEEEELSVKAGRKLKAEKANANSAGGKKVSSHGVQTNTNSHVVESESERMSKLYPPCADVYYTADEPRSKLCQTKDSVSKEAILKEKLVDFGIELSPNQMQKLLKQSLSANGFCSSFQKLCTVVHDCSSQSNIGRFINSDMVDQIRRLNKDVREQQSKLNALSYNFDKYSPVKTTVVLYTGCFNWSTLIELYNYVSICVREEPIDQISQFQEFVLTLMKLKLGLHGQDLAFRFNVDPAIISEILDKWVHVFRNSLIQLMEWPEDEPERTEHRNQRWRYLKLRFEILMAYDGIDSMKDKWLLQQDIDLIVHICDVLNSFVIKEEKSKPEPKPVQTLPEPVPCFIEEVVDVNHAEEETSKGQVTKGIKSTEETEKEKNGEEATVAPQGHSEEGAGSCPKGGMKGVPVLKASGPEPARRMDGSLPEPGRKESDVIHVSENNEPSTSLRSTRDEQPIDVDETAVSAGDGNTRTSIDGSEEIQNLDSASIWERDEQFNSRKKVTMYFVNDEGVVIGPPSNEVEVVTSHHTETPYLFEHYSDPLDAFSLPKLHASHFQPNGS